MGEGRETARRLGREQLEKRRSFLRELRGFAAHAPKAKTFSFAQVIGLLEGNVRLELLESPIQRASVFS